MKEQIDLEMVPGEDLARAINSYSRDHIWTVGGRDFSFIDDYLADIARTPTRYNDKAHEFLNLFLELFQREITDELETMEIEAKFPEPNDEE